MTRKPRVPMRISSFVSLLCVFILSSCAQTQLASHIAKTASPPSKSEGNFKVGKPYKVEGKWYTPQETYNFTETGIASWYGDEFHGKPTANGELFDMNELTAAHRTLQMPSLVRVTNLENGRSLIVRVNDRGPFKRGRVMDLSKRAAELLGFKNKGMAKVKLQVLSKESQDIAMAAKRGQDTRGMEVAMNDGRRPHIQPASLPAGQTREPIQTVSLEPMGAPSTEIPGHISNQGNFMPDPVVKQFPVTPTHIYVQAGSFGNQENATRLAAALGQHGPAKIYPALVNNQQFYRVRLGPLSTVDYADGVLSKLAQAGHPNAIIVVE